MHSALLLVLAVQWNAPDAVALIDRAVARRAVGEASLTRYRSKARGVLLFLAEVGPPPTAPRLVQADELVVEVYWEAPNRSKQAITAWRERRWLPTDLRYHRDHLGIVTDDFGDAILLGDGDEVQDVPHPLSPSGRDLYQFATGGRLTLRGATGDVVVREVRVRPADPAEPRVAGALYLDEATADLVRFQFSFTAAAYRQAELEDIAVVLERALSEGRWLPWRQEIEIRRRAAWLQFPVRTIIRGRWEIDDYDLTASSRPDLRALPTYSGLNRARPDTGWAEPLESVIARGGGATPRADLEAIRSAVARLVGHGAVSIVPPARLAFGSLSDLVRVNRVQGLAVGMGASLRLGGDLRIQPALGYGFSSRRLTGGTVLALDAGAMHLDLKAQREVRDLSDWAPASGLLSSILAQEAGNDLGDWLERDRLVAGAAWIRPSVVWRIEAGVERTRSLSVAATPARGEYRANPALGAGSAWTARAEFTWTGAGQTNPGTRVQATVEAGGYDRGYGRGTLDLSTATHAGPGRLAVRLQGGATLGTAPAWRTFVLGGRSTLVGEPYRAFGGRHMVLGRLEWPLPLSLLAFKAGDYVEIPLGGALAPFAALGWSDAPPDGLPWAASRGLRPVLGVASELLFNSLRIEVGWAPRTERVGIVLDATPAWWPIL